MPAPREEPCTKISLNLPDRLLEKLAEYPGLQTWKIEMALEYALQMGCFMTVEEARKIAHGKAKTLLKLEESRKRK